MKPYTQLTHEQRYQIHACMKAGWDQTEIAREIGTHKSTVSREFRRNRGRAATGRSRHTPWPWRGARPRSAPGSRHAIGHASSDCSAATGAPSRRADGSRRRMGSSSATSGSTGTSMRTKARAAISIGTCAARRRGASVTGPTTDAGPSPTGYPSRIARRRSITNAAWATGKPIP